MEIMGTMGHCWSNNTDSIGRSRGIHQMGFINDLGVTEWG
jgi:hypothetical protein